MHAGRLHHKVKFGTEQVVAKQLFFYPIADSYLLVAGIAMLLMLVVTFVGPRRSGLTPRRRMALSAVRMLIVLLTVFALLRPTLVKSEMKKDKATLILLIDQTRSMSVHDGLSGHSRWELLRKAFDQAAPELAEASKTFEVKAYAFDAETHNVEMTDGHLSLPDTPEGGRTAIGSALDDILRLESGKRILGIIMGTDGRQQAAPPRDTAPQTVAPRLRHQGDAVFPIVFGQAKGLGTAQDVAVKNLQVPESVYVKNEMPISGLVQIEGYVNREIPVRVEIENPQGKTEIVAVEKIKATTDGQTIPVDVQYIPELPGEYKVKLVAEPQPGEVVPSNNELSTFVQVIKGGLNVLYIEGSLRFESKFLRRSLDAARDIKVDFVRVDAQHPETAPSNFAESFEPGKYDVYIIGDVDAAAFKEADLEKLVEAVNRGAGLIMLGGLHSFGAGGWYNTPLGTSNVLPIAMDRLEKQNFGEAIRPDLHVPGPLKMTPTPFASRHFALTLAPPGAENTALWAKLPELDGANRIVIPSGRAGGAIILADAPGNGDEGIPLLVTQNYGKGRVMAFAADSTWRWWMHGYETAHKRFWRQMVLWLARKDDASDGNVSIHLASRRFAPGERVEFELNARSPQNEPIADADYKVEVVAPPKGQRSQPVIVRQGEQSTGVFRETEAAGDYTIEVTASKKGQLIGTTHARFSVMSQDMELDNASADPDSMETLARATGGHLVAPENLTKLIKELTSSTAQHEVEQITRETLWDGLPIFVAFAVLLTVEWFLRKKWGLV
jgi:uncharacterized membrane protein